MSFLVLLLMQFLINFVQIQMKNRSRRFDGCKIYCIWCSYVQAYHLDISMLFDISIPNFLTSVSCIKVQKHPKSYIQSWKYVLNRWSNRIRSCYLSSPPRFKSYLSVFWKFPNPGHKETYCFLFHYVLFLVLIYSINILVFKRR